MQQKETETLQKEEVWRGGVNRQVNHSQPVIHFSTYFCVETRSKFAAMTPVDAASCLHSFIL